MGRELVDNLIFIRTPTPRYMDISKIVTILAVLAMAAVCIQPVAAEEDAATNYYNIAQQYISNGNYEQALVYLDKVLVSNTTLLEGGDGLMYTYKDRIALLTDLGRYDEALKAADQALLRYKNEPGIWNNKGWTYYKMGKYNEAAEAYDQAVKADPTYLKGWINKGDALVKAGRPGDAVHAYKQALVLDPENKDAKAGLELSQKSQDSMIVVYAVIAVILIGAILLYVKFRKPAGKQDAGKETKK